MASRRLFWILFSLFLVSFVTTSVAIFAHKPALLVLGLGVGAYALKDDALRHVKRLRGTR